MSSKDNKEEKESSIVNNLILLLITIITVFGSVGSIAGELISMIFSVLQYISIFGLFVYVIYKLYFDWKKGKLSNKAMALNVLVLILAIISSWFIFPVVISEILYEGVYLHIPHLIIFSIGLLGIYLTYTIFDTAHRMSLKIIYGVLSLLITIGGPFGVSYITDWKTAEAFKFEIRDSVVEIDPYAIRYTPRKVAFTKMEGGFNSSEYRILEKLTNAVRLADGSFGYVTPVVPDGLINTYNLENSGYVVFNDSVNTSDDNRVDRLAQVQKYGEEMEWTENIWRHLYIADMFCKYSNIVYLQLDENDPTKRIAVAPKIKYEWKFPFVLVPYWGGTTLVHSEDGKVETLSVEEALADVRLKGLRLFPSELSSKYVSIQKYDKGLMDAFYKREGKISLPEFPGDNQMSFYTPSIDENEYFVSYTVPDGDSNAMFRIYFINTYTGERSLYEYDINAQVLGPIAALRQAKTIPYKWIEDENINENGDSGDGNFRLIEPVYITKDERIYLKFTVTTREYMGITSSIVVDLKSGNAAEYKTRREFFTWLIGSHIYENADETTLQKAMKLIKKGRIMVQEGETLLELYMLEH